MPTIYNKSTAPWHWIALSHWRNGSLCFITSRSGLFQSLIYIEMTSDLYINWKRFIYKSQTIYIFIVNSLYIDCYLVSHKPYFDLKKFVSSYFWLQNPFPFRCLFRIIPNSASLLKTKKFSNAIVLTGCPGADALNRFCGFIRASFFWIRGIEDFILAFKGETICCRR